MVYCRYVLQNMIVCVLSVVDAQCNTSYVTDVMKTEASRYTLVSSSV